MFKNPLTVTTFLELIDRLTGFLFLISSVLGVVMILVSAFMYMTSGGDPQKVTAAKNALLYALLGVLLAIVFLGIVPITCDILGIATPPC